MYFQSWNLWKVNGRKRKKDASRNFWQPTYLREATKKIQIIMAVPTAIKLGGGGANCTAIKKITSFLWLPLGGALKKLAFFDENFLCIPNPLFHSKFSKILGRRLPDRPLSPSMLLRKQLHLFMLAFYSYFLAGKEQKGRFFYGSPYLGVYTTNI